MFELSFSPGVKLDGHRGTWAGCLRVNQWEILTKKFTSDVDSSYNDAAHIQNDLLYICLFKRFSSLED